MKDISIIIYNINNCDEPLDCFNSILEQCFKNYEVIVLDDGKNSFYSNFIHKHTTEYDNFKRVLINNATQSQLLNEALATLSGRSVMFLSTSDLLPKNALRNMHLKKVETGNDVVLTRVMVQNKSGLKPHKRQEQGFKKTSIRDQGKLKDILLNYYSSFGVKGHLFDIEIVRNNGMFFFDGETIEENLFFMCSIIYSEKISICNNYSYIQTSQDKDKQTNHVIDQHISNFLHIVKKHGNDYPEFIKVIKYFFAKYKEFFLENPLTKKELKKIVKGYRLLKGIIKRKNNAQNPRVACILDSPSYEGLKYEANLIRIDKKYSEAIIKITKPSFLLVESCYEGNNDFWSKQINTQNSIDLQLDQILTLCKNQKISTVFWMNESIEKLHEFIKPIEKFDYVFCADKKAIDKLIEDDINKNVYYLPFAIEPRIHNPQNERQEEDPQRITYLEKDGTTASINDIKSNFKVKKNIQNESKLPQNRKFDYLGSKIKNNNYNYGIWTSKKSTLCIDDLKSLTDTYIPRYVFEYLSFEIPILGLHGAAAEELFGSDLIKNLSDKSSNNIMFYLNNQIECMRIAHRLRRKLSEKNTYHHRMCTICKHIGVELPEHEGTGITFLTSTIRQDFMQNCFDSFLRQKIEKKQLVLVLNKNDMDISLWNEYRNRYPEEDITIIRVDEKYNLGKCLNTAAKHAKYNLISKMDDDDYYAEYYASDIIMDSKCHIAPILGIRSKFVYFEENNQLGYLYYGEYKYKRAISGGSITFDKDVFNSVKFNEDIANGLDSRFFKDAARLGYRIYATGIFNCRVLRQKDKSKHTYQAEDANRLHRTKFIDNVTDMIKYVEA